MSRWLIIALLLAALRLDAQVYAIGPGPNRPFTVYRVDEHKWFIGSFGLVQFGARTSEGAPWVRQTTVHFGNSSFRTRLPAVMLVSVAVASVLALIAFPLCRIGSRQRHLPRLT